MTTCATICTTRPRLRPTRGMVKALMAQARREQAVGRWRDDARPGAASAAEQRSTPTSSVASLYFSGTSLRVTMGIVAAGTGVSVPAAVVVDRTRAADIAAVTTRMQSNNPFDRDLHYRPRATTRQNVVRVSDWRHGCALTSSPAENLHPPRPDCRTAGVQLRGSERSEGHVSCNFI